jgi:hypothetical protein
VKRAPAAKPPPAPPIARSRWAEWFTVVVLLAMAGVMLWLNLSLWRRSTPLEFPPFDLKNPMLDARAHECVEQYDVARPGDALCVSVRDEGVVLRPSKGPAVIDDRDMRRAAPYLVCRQRRATPSGGCSGKEDENEDVLLYPLGAFGLPDAQRVRLDSVEAVRAETGGRERLLYLAVLQSYGAGGTFKCYVSAEPDARVTGLVQVELWPEKPGSKPQTFRYHDVGDCP